VSEGVHAGLSPNPWFDPAWYAAEYPKIPQNVAPFVHFIAVGAAAGFRPNPIPLPTLQFDIPLSWWAAHGASLVKHHGKLNASMGEKNTSFLLSVFQPAYYRRIANLPSDVSSIAALDHFLSIGLSKNLSPSPPFEPEFYAEQWRHSTGLALPADLPPILHWLQEGRTCVRVPTRLFSEKYYRDREMENFCAQLSSRVSTSWWPGGSAPIKRRSPARACGRPG
jgi:hypothetical protein